VSGGTLEALQNVHEWKRPAIVISKRSEKQINMVRHDHHRMQMNAGCVDYRRRGRPRHTFSRQRLQPTFSQTVFKHKIARRFRQNSPSPTAEGNE